MQVKTVLLCLWEYGDPVQSYVLGMERDISVDNVNVGYLENRYCVESWSLLPGSAGWQT